MQQTLTRPLVDLVQVKKCMQIQVILLSFHSYGEVIFHANELLQHSNNRGQATKKRTPSDTDKCEKLDKEV